MRIKCIISAICLLFGACAGRADSVRQFFISEPGEVFELITQGVRAAMVTMAEDGQKIESDNLQGGKVKIDSLSQNYMKVRCSEVKQVELKLLTKGTADTVIAVVETFRLPAADSRISFYNTKWQPIPLEKCLKGGMPGIAAFVKKGTPSQVVEMITRTVAFPLIELTFGEGDSRLVATHQLQAFLSREDYAKVQPYLQESITYDIDKLKLKPSKQK